VTAEALVRAVGSKDVEYAPSTEEAVERVVKRAEDGDVILTQGAGSVSGIAPVVLEKLSI
jgi:UDP-N-acetylmuramate--alanine ligase